MEFKHSGRLGDLVYALPLIQTLTRYEGAKASLYLVNDYPHKLPGRYVHPSGDVMMNDSQCRFIQTLLACQPYIESVIIGSHKDVSVRAIDLDVFRKIGLNLKASVLPAWYRKLFSFPIDFEKSWLSVPQDSVLYPLDKYTVIVHRSTRYNNEAIDYHFLKDIDRVGMIGLPFEYAYFIKKYRLENCPNIEYIKTPDAKMLAQVLLSCRVFLGNQSLPFAIAEGLKIPRALEDYEPEPTVVPVGGTCIEYLYTDRLIAFLNREFSLSLSFEKKSLLDYSPLVFMDDSLRFSDINNINSRLYLKIKNRLKLLLPGFCIALLKYLHRFFVFRK